MRIAVFGDVMGRSGRTALIERLPGLRRKLSLDFVVVNAENAAGGFGVTPRICEELLEAGADVLTTGNHAYDQRDDVDIFTKEPRLLRPANFPASNPGRGAGMYEDAEGRNVLVLHAQGQRGMWPIDDPCAAIDSALEHITLGREADAVIVDFHAETTSEKYTMGHYLDGRVSLVVGTHTHVPTADEQILPRGTGYITDLGMCGDYDSVIGMEKSEPLQRFVTKMQSGRFTPAAGEATLCGVLIETDASGLAVSIDPLRIGGRLRQSAPSV
ncbi:MAG: TIGR00282 family metallophosphoesterase [Pseudomonadota bacterium]